MKPLLVVLILFSFRSIAEDKPMLVSASWVHENKANPDLVILQVNFLKLDYDREHIEGARYLYPEWLSPDSPDGNMNVPAIDDATKTLQGLGITKKSHIVLCYTKAEVSPTTRMFAVLEHLGLTGRVSLLDGGLEAWKKEGYPISNVEPVFRKGDVKLSPKKLIVDKEYVLNSLDKKDVVVVDARLKRFYDGEPTGYPRDGHIKGAQNIPYQDMVDENNKFKDVAALGNQFTTVASTDKEVIVYCFIGQTASVVYFAGRLLGYNMKLYDGSMQEWSRLDHLPMEKTSQ